MPDGSGYRFTENGASFAPPLGRRDILSRRADGGFTLATAGGGMSMEFDTAGRIESLADPFGNEHEYAYDGGGQLIRVSDTAGSERYLDVHWGADGRISAVVDSAGRQVEYRYSVSGALVEVEDVVARTWHFNYSGGRFGPVLAEHRDPWQRIVASIVYDSRDRVTSYTESGQTFFYSYAYQGQRDRTAKSNQQGASWLFQIGDGGLVTAVGGASRSGTRDYNADGSIAAEVDERGVRTTYTYDGAGRVASVTGDAAGTQAIRYDYEYSAAFPQRVTALLGRSPGSQTFDTRWPSWRHDYHPPGSAAPGKRARSYRLEGAAGTPVVEAEYEYSTRGQLTKHTDPVGEFAELGYNEQGDMVSLSEPANSLNGPRRVTLYSHDELGRVIGVTDQEGHLTTYAYDPLNRVTRTTLPGPAAGSTFDYTTVRTYDEFDPVTGLLFEQEIAPDGSIARVGRDQFDRVVVEINELGEQTSREYANGYLAAIVDNHGNRTGYLRDSTGRLMGTQFPDGASEHYLYWPDGAIRTLVKRGGAIINYHYDSFGRLSVIDYGGGARVVRKYNGSLLSEIIDERVTPPVTQVFHYDDALQPARVEQDGVSLFEMDYDPAHRLARLESASGNVESYLYYPSGAPRSVAWEGIGVVGTYSYDRRGLETSLTLSNGVVRISAFDRQGRLTSRSTSHPLSGIVASFEYDYDRDSESGAMSSVGRRTGVTMVLPALGLNAARATFAYDAAGQLTGAKYPATLNSPITTFQWAYDGIGNRVSETVNGGTRVYAYAHAGASAQNWNRVISDGVASYTYDPDGNVLTRTRPGDVVSFDWKSDGTIGGIAQNGSYTVVAQADVLGRVAYGGPGESFDWHLLTDADGRQRFYGPAIDELVALRADGTVSATNVALDGLGNVVAEFDDAGSVLGARVFDAWGGTLATTGSAASGVPGFMGREMLAHGLVDFRTRLYSTEVGRFLQEDRLMEVAPIVGRAIYGFAGNDPVNWRDPFGLQQCDLVVRWGRGTSWTEDKNGEWVLKEVKDCSFPSDCATSGANNADAPPWTGFIRCYYERVVETTKFWKRNLCFRWICRCPGWASVENCFAVGGQHTTSRIETSWYQRRFQGLAVSAQCRREDVF